MHPLGGLQSPWTGKMQNWQRTAGDTPCNTNLKSEYKQLLGKGLWKSRKGKGQLLISCKKWLYLR